MSENSLVNAWRRPSRAVARSWRLVSARRATLLMVGSVALGAALLAGRLDQGWWHHDDGSLAHSAERVLAGELPHRDFAELYTGVLTFANAAVFALLGEDMFNLRLPLVVLFLAFVAAFFAIARRLVSPLWAFAATLAAISWSVPVYPVPVPSWHLLFLSTIGTYGVVRFFETRGRRWLLLAGLCGGLGVTIKVVGVWYVVAVALALLAEPLVHPSVEEPEAPRTRGAAVIASAGIALVLVLAVLSGQLGSGEVATLLVPIATLLGALALLGWRSWRDGGHGLWGRSAGDIGAFSVAALVPVALFVVPYVATSSVGDLVEGVFVAPQSRFEFAAWEMPSAASLLWAVPVVAVFVLRAKIPERRRLLVDVVASSGIVFLLLTARTQPSYSLLWDASRALAPVVIVTGALVVARRTSGEARLPALVSLLVLVAGFSTLLQFPFAAPVYYCYVAPLVLLAAIAVLRALGAANGVFPCVLLVALGVFGLAQLDRQSISTLGLEFRPDPQLIVLDTERASIRVTPAAKREYDAVRYLVQRHNLPGRPIFAGPDAPEVYFLTKAGNPTPAIIDFLDRSGSTRGNQLVRLLVDLEIAVVVLNHEPQQSPPLDGRTVALIRSLYNASERVGHFEVRWLSSDP